MPLLASTLQFDQAVRERFEALGLGVELSGFSLPEFLDERALPLAIQVAKKWLSGFRLPVSMHGAFVQLQPVGRDPWLVDVCRRRLLQSLEIAHELGIGRVVFHPNYRTGTDYAVWLEGQLRFWEGIVPAAERYGIIALLENTVEGDPHYLTDIVRHFQNPHLSVCFDTGHTHCFTSERLPLKAWVQGLGADLSHIHLHSNHGLADEHLAFDQGTLSFEGFWEGVAALDAEPWIVIETKTRSAFEASLQAYRGLSIAGLPQLQGDSV